MSDVAAEKNAVHAEEAVTPKKRGCCCSWCRWYYWVGGVLLFILVVLLIIFLGVVPAVAQKSVNNTYLELDGLHILAPKADGFTLSINSTIKGAKIHNAKIDGFESDFSLPGEDAFMQVDIPAVKTEDEIPVSVEGVATTVSDSAAFMKFAHTLMGSEDLEVEISGKTKIRIGKLAPKVNYNEKVPMKGLNKLNGMAVIHYDIIEDKEGNNLKATILIPNPSVATIELGDVAIELFTLDDTVSFGNGTLPNLKLTPGNNNYTFVGKVGLKPMFAMVEKARETGKPSYFKVMGRSVKYNGQDIPWLAGPLAADYVPVRLGAADH